MRKVIISLAPVQAGASIDAVKLAEDVEKSVKLGAAMCHLHCLSLIHILIWNQTQTFLSHTMIFQRLIQCTPVEYEIQGRKMTVLETEEYAIDRSEFDLSLIHI